jgi:transposase
MASGAIWAELHMALRERVGREASPSAAVLDSQSIKSAEKGVAKTAKVGYDASKQVKGHKIHALVDSEGLPMRVVVHSAAIQDRDAAGLVLDKIRRHFPWLELIWTDDGYNAWQVDAALAKAPRLRMEIVKRSDDTKGFVVLARRWVVERTFPWFGRNRRLAKDFENLAEALAATFVTLASIQLALDRELNKPPVGNAR